MEAREQLKPVKEFLLGLMPDNKPTDTETPVIQSYFDKLILAEPDRKEELYERFKNFLVSAAKTAIDGTPNKQMLLLAGPQGIYKTSYLQHIIPSVMRICPPAYLYDTYPYMIDNHIKHWFIHYEEIWDEYYLQKIKEILDTETITYRIPYSVRKTTNPRISNIIVDTNQKFQNLDNSIILIQLKEIDPTYLEINPVKLWTDVMKIYRL